MLQEREDPGGYDFVASKWALGMRVANRKIIQKGVQTQTLKIARAYLPFRCQSRAVAMSLRAWHIMLV